MKSFRKEGNLSNFKQISLITLHLWFENSVGLNLKRKSKQRYSDVYARIVVVKMCEGVAEEALRATYMLYQSKAPL